MTTLTATNSFAANSPPVKKYLRIDMDLMARGTDTIFRLNEEVPPEFVSEAHKKPVATALGALKRMIVALNAQANETHNKHEVSGGYDGTTSSTRDAIILYVGNIAVTMEDIRYYIAQGAPDHFGAYTASFPDNPWALKDFGCRQVDDEFLEDLALYFPQCTAQNVEPALNRDAQRRPEPAN